MGAVVYVGQETKAMLNSLRTPSKARRLESYMNRETLRLFVFLFIMCIVVALKRGEWLEMHKDQLYTSHALGRGILSIVMVMERNIIIMVY